MNPEVEAHLTALEAVLAGRRPTAKVRPATIAAVRAGLAAGERLES